MSVNCVSPNYCKQRSISLPVLMLAAVITTFGIWVSDTEASYLYAAHAKPGTVSVIDTTSLEIVETIESVGWLPQGIDVNPDSKKAYVTNHLSGDVAVIDVDRESERFNRVIKRIPIPSEKPWLTGIEITADGKRAYVASYYSVFVIDLASDEVIAEVDGLSSAMQLTITPDSREVYVGNYYQSIVQVIKNSEDPKEIEITGEIPLQYGSNGIIDARYLRATANGRYVYVTAVWDRWMAIIDTSKKKVIRAVPLRSIGGDIVFTSDGSNAFIGGILPYTIMKLRTDLNTVTDRARLPILDGSSGIDISSDNKTVYVADFLGGRTYHEDVPGRIIVVDAARNKVKKLIEVDAEPIDVAYVE